MNYIIKGVKLIDSTVERIVGNRLTFDKVDIALKVTKAWAYAGLYTTKILETFFMAILVIPDKWLEIPGNLVSQVSNTAGEKIQILSANSDMGDITNKLKLFLRFYWEKGGPASSSEYNGFDFLEFKKLLKSSMLYCCYLIADKASTLLVESDDADPELIYMSKAADKKDKKKLMNRHVIFDDISEQKEIDYSQEVLKMMSELTSSF